MKGFIHSLALTAILTIILTLMISGIKLYDHETLKNILQLEKIRLENNNKYYNQLNEQAKIKEQIITQLNKITNKDQVNYTIWDYPIYINETKIYYPIKEYLEKTQLLDIQQVTSCACNDINSCNLITNTNYNWGLEICDGVPIAYKIKIFSNNITMIVPYYLFYGNCTIKCSE